MNLQNIKAFKVLYGHLEVFSITEESIMMKPNYSYSFGK